MKGTTQKAQKTALEKKHRERSCRNNWEYSSETKIRCDSKYHLLLFHPFSSTTNYKLIRSKMLNLDGSEEDLEVQEKAPFS